MGITIPLQQNYAKLRAVVMRLTGGASLNNCFLMNTEPALSLSHPQNGTFLASSASAVDKESKVNLDNITIVLPAFNEAENLPSLLTRVSSSMKRTGLNFRILVVNDGSTDQTAEVLQRNAADCQVEILTHTKNMGLGAAIRSGLLEASAADGIVVTMDADNSHDPAIIVQMIQKIRDGYDLVIASRFQDGGQVVGLKMHRRFLSWAASSLMRVCCRYPNVRDYTSGYRAYRASILRDLQSRYGAKFITENGFACMFELLLKLRSIGARASEIPLVLRYDQKIGPSKMPILRTIARYGVLTRKSVTWTLFTDL